MHHLRGISTETKVRCRPRFSSVATPADRRGDGKCFVPSLGGEKLQRSAGEIFLSGERWAKHVSGLFWAGDFWGIFFFFGSFSNHFSYRI